jgi:hypothetical protein|tara:strand:+ start:1872 stop:2336 length:465 start_codon:yes stop_codon:yes gene_type:complete
MKKDTQEITQNYFAKQSIVAKFFDKVIDILDDFEYNILINKNKQTLKGKNMATTAKNYTDEMVAKMVEAYIAEPNRDTVDSLAEQFGKTTRSIIAKLSREGVYQAQPRTTKSGETVVSKSELVTMIAAHFDIEVPTLVKAGKQDLQKLADAIQS